MMLYESDHCMAKRLVNAAWVTGWGISQGPSLGDRIKKTKNKFKQTQANFMYVLTCLLRLSVSHA